MSTEEQIIFNSITDVVRVTKLFIEGKLTREAREAVYDSHMQLIKELLASQRKEKRESVEKLFTCIGPQDEIHRCSYGHCGNCGECNVISKVLALLEDSK